MTNNQTTDTMMSARMTMEKFTNILDHHNFEYKDFDANQCHVMTPFKGFTIAVITDFESNATVKYMMGSDDLDHTIFECKLTRPYNYKLWESDTDFILSRILESIRCGLNRTYFWNMLHSCRRKFVGDEDSRSLEIFIEMAQNRGFNKHLLKYYKAVLYGRRALWEHVKTLQEHDQGKRIISKY